MFKLPQFPPFKGHKVAYICLALNTISTGTICYSAYSNLTSQKGSHPQTTPPIEPDSKTMTDKGVEFQWKVPVQREKQIVKLAAPYSPKHENFEVSVEGESRSFALSSDPRARDLQILSVPLNPGEQKITVVFKNLIPTPKIDGSTFFHP